MQCSGKMGYADKREKICTKTSLPLGRASQQRCYAVPAGDHHFPASLTMHPKDQAGMSPAQQIWSSCLLCATPRTLMSPDWDLEERHFGSTVIQFLASSKPLHLTASIFSYRNGGDVDNLLPNIMCRRALEIVLSSSFNVNLLSKIVGCLRGNCHFMCILPELSSILCFILPHHCRDSLARFLNNGQF